MLSRNALAKRPTMLVKSSYIKHTETAVLWTRGNFKSDAPHCLNVSPRRIGHHARTLSAMGVKFAISVTSGPDEFDETTD